MNEKALTTVQQVGGLSTLKSRWQTLAQATQDVLKDGIDYGVIPGTKQKTLLKPGAEKLSTLFGLRPFFTLQDSMEDWERGRFYYRYRCTLMGSDGAVADSEGSCTTMEKKYRWRTQGKTCPKCGRENTIIKGHAEYGGGWLCFHKKGGCGAKFKDGDKSIEDQPRGRIENPEPYDLINTVQKMAQKRALVAAVLVATGASAFFTQDMEHILEGVVVEESPSKKPAAPTPKKSQRKKSTPPPKPNGRTLKELMAFWSERWNEAKALGLDVKPLAGSPTKTEVITRGKALAARIEQAKTETEAITLSAATVAAIIEAGLSENVYSVAATMEHSNLASGHDATTVITWWKQYRASRDAAGADTSESAAVANAWLSGQPEVK